MRQKTKSQTAMRIQIEPLTYQSLKGKTYERSPEVEAQIAVALLLERSALIERVAIMDFKTTGYFQEECLVYLIRRFQREGDGDLVSALMNRLVMRIGKRTNWLISKHLHRHYVNECYESVIYEVTCRVIDLETDRDDFAQSRFWLWLEGRVFNVLRTYLRRQADDRITDTLDEFDDDEDAERKKKIGPLKDGSPLPDALVIDAETRKLLEKEADKLLEKLDPNERIAFLLRHCVGWEIENHDPSVMTISRYFNRTPRTIRNWLKGAEEKLQKCQGGQQ